MENIRKIDRQQVEDVVALSPMQEGMLFHYIKNLGSDQYFQQFELALSGGMDLACFQQAWQWVVDTNEMLRTIIAWERVEKPVQIVLKQMEVPIHTVDISSTVDREQSRFLEEWKWNDRQEKFNLKTGPLFRIGLCKLTENDDVMLVSSHHIIFDGWSNGVILKEFFSAYEALRHGKTPQPVKKRKFKEYIKWMQQADRTERDAFWSTYLQGIDTRTELPADKETIHEIETVRHYRHLLAQPLQTALARLTGEERVTLGAVLYAAWGIVLQKYTCQTDVLFGTPVSGRPTELSGVEEMVGLFINTLPLRVKTTGTETVAELLHSVQSAIQARQPFESTPLAELKQNYLQSGLFQSIVVVENYPLDRAALQTELTIHSYAAFEMTNFDLTVSLLPFAELELDFAYNPDRFTESTMEQLCGHLVQILSEMASRPQGTVAELEMLTPEEREEILEQFNQPWSTVGGTLLTCFEEKVAMFPEKVALVQGDNQMTYSELNSAANQLARRLRNHGVGPDQLVGLMVERSFAMLIGVMGILKAGGAYVPIDPAYPDERIQYILHDSGVRLLLTTEVLRNATAFEGKIISLDEEGLFTGDVSNLPQLARLEHLAYVIYTSGSTGKPKGTMVEHGNVMNLLLGMEKAYPVEATDAILLKTAFTFDVSVAELFGWFVGCGRLVLLEVGAEKDPQAILRTIEREKVTHVNFVASMLGLLLTSLTPEGIRALSGVKYIMQAGERLPREMARQFYDLVQGPRLENLYGPTEATVYVTRYPVSEWDGNGVIPIGKPLTNCHLYIVDPYGHLQPVGVTGEICIGGAGVARGYLGRSELTAEKFIPNSFGNGRVYRSGDLGRWLPDGQMECIGRMDHQVKIRGYRIELGEVEAQLQGIPGVGDAVVLDRMDAAGEKYLCAYVIPAAESDSATVVRRSVAELREELAKILPEYMIPTRFIVLEEMPHLSNGKVDRKALRGIDGGEALVQEYVAPTTETEERLVKIWAQTLGVARIGVYDHFFEMGGHSLKAASAIAKMGREFGREIPLKVIFAEPTVKAMAAWLQRTEEGIFAAIEPVEERPYYPASSAQRRLWVLHQLHEGDTSYNISGAMRVEGTLDNARLEAALRQLMVRHEALRTSFAMVDGEVVQHVHADLAVPLTYRLWNAGMREFVQPFDLTNAPLFRVEVVQRDEEDLIYVDMHHIIADGVSLEILMKELTQLYGGESLPPVRVQYKDYAVWQGNFLRSEKMQAGEAYWQGRFAGDIPVLNLPTDAPRPAVQNYQGETYTFALDERLARELRRFAQNQGATLYMTLLAGFTILLSRYAGQEDIVVGTPVAGRPIADVLDTIGMFVNTVVMRNRPEGRKRFGEFLQEVKVGALEAFEYQDYPFEMLVESLGLERDLSRTPLFDVMLILQNTQRGGHVAGKPRFQPFAVERGTAKFDLTLEAVEQDGEIVCKLEYCTALFARRTMVQMAGHFRQILQEIVQNPEIHLREIGMLTTEERQTILVDWNATARDIPHVTLQELFEAQVERTPEATALIAGERMFTYRALNQQANQLARVLREKGVQPNEAVGLMVSRSAELILGVLGVLKAGAAYLPLDPEYPMERVRYMLENSQTRIVLTDGQHFGERFGVGCLVEEIDITDPRLFVGEGSNLERTCEPEDLAYILYTSGSTGKPKGVMIEHRAVVNYLLGVVEVVDLTEVRTVACTTTVSFDIFVVESLLPLVYGMRVVVANEDEQRVSHLLDALLVKYEVDLIQMTPTRMHYFLQDEHRGGGFAGLKVILLGGESMTKALLDGLRAQSGARIYNEYGPTEATVFATYKDVTCGGEITIGKPIANYQVYVVNSDLMPLPVNVPGELCIAGLGLARGYCQRPDLTDEQFIPNPFGRPGEKMYRTGDLVRWRPDGEIEYMGRMDFQVKIRGFRIELGEIENQLLRYPGIAEAMVVAQEDAVGTRYLIGYCTGEGQMDLADVKEYLASALPEYMLPAYLMQLERWPLTPNGKIDRKALPDVAVAAREEQAYVVPETAEEETLAGIWAEVLQVEKVGVLDDFFALGGHSLKAASVVSRVAKVFGVEMPLREVFQMPTVREMARWIRERTDGARGDRFGEIVVQGERAHYPTSSAQKRIFVLQQLTQDTSYNMPAALRIEGPLHRERLENAFARLIERHDALRTRFGLVNGDAVQMVLPRVEFVLGWSEEVVSADALQAWVVAKMRVLVQSFDLERAPLLRVEVTKIGEEDHVLFFDMHHIISDGTSMGILMEELAQLYAGRELAPLRIQYKDYAVWQNQFMRSERWEREEAFWVAQFADEVPVLNLPTDHPRPLLQNFEGASVRFVLPPTLRDGLMQLAQTEGVTLYMALLACYSIILGRYSGQADVVVGSPVAGRPHPDLETILGMFANTLAMRNRPENRKTFQAFLAEVKENALQAFENQDYAFEMLVEQLSIQRSLSRNPLFDTLFVLQNTRAGELAAAEMRFTPVALESVTAKFDLALSAVETDEGILCELEYATSLFRRETVERLGMHLTNIIREVLACPTVCLGEITMISPEEREWLLQGFGGKVKSANSLREQLKDPDAGGIDVLGTYVEDASGARLDVGQDGMVNQMDLQREMAPLSAQNPVKCGTRVHHTLIHLWFEEQVARTSDQMAVNYEGQTLTYGELNAKANQLARQLREQGIGRDQVVGLLVDRSLDLVIGLLGVLKAGGAYLPIDPEYPLERIQYMLEDSKASVLLTQSGVQERLDQQLHFPGAVLYLDEGVYVGETANLECINEPQDLLYVIYTSGSTGKPKGVMLEHRNLTNLMEFEFSQTRIDFGKVLQFTTISFDVSFQEIFSTLLSGGELYLISQERRNEPNRLFAWMEAHEIRTVFMPVAFLKFVFTEGEYAERFPRTVRHIITAGEQLIVNDGLRKHLQKHGVYLHNHYGPSETHVVTTLTLAPEGEIPELPTIGMPIRDTQIYIVNEMMRLQPVGVDGEIYIGGAGVGRGYLGREDLTAERFGLNSFNNGERLYRTGDRGRWLAHGEIEFRGRNDQQVKIRGFRVEPGEVESELLKHPALKEAVVVAREDTSGMKYLAAYVVAQSEVSMAEIREHLKNELPDYMIPSVMSFLEAMPLTPSGKIDRRALPDLSEVVDGARYVAPRNRVEEMLQKIWQELLNVPQIGVEEDFFALGGHSLKAMSMISRVLQEFQVELPLREVFQTPTIAGVARYITGADKSFDVAIASAGEREYYPTSSTQQRIFVMHQLNEESDTSYNMPGIFQVKGKLDLNRLESALHKLIQRQEGLRTSFDLVEGEPVQRIHFAVPFAVEVLDLCVVDEELAQRLENAMRQWVKPFDLQQAPLFRVSLVQTNAGEWLFFDMHHIISDGTSLGIFVDEVMQFYHGQSVPEIRVQYKDFAVWQREILLHDVMHKHGKFWLDRFTGNVPILNLPTDESRPAVQRYEGDVVSFKVDREMRDRLYALAEHQGATLYMTLFAAYHLLLVKYSGQEEIIIGSPVAGRPHADLESIIGVFINTLAMRNHSCSNETFADFLAQVKENTLAAFEHQDYPFEMLVEHLHLKRDLSRNPLFDVMFILQNTRSATWTDQELTLVPWEFSRDVAKFDLTLHAEEREGEIHCIFEYSTTLYRRSTIQRMVRHFLHILDQVSGEPEMRMGDVQLLTQAERQRILYEWNETRLPYAVDKTIHQLIAEQVARTPEKPALTFGEETLTYRELNDRANLLARYLCGKGVGAEEIVGIMMPRSLDLIIGMLAVLKAGGAYLPIDPTYPARRVAYMLEDSGTRLVLTKGMASGDAVVVTVDEILSSLYVSTVNLNEGILNLGESNEKRSEGTLNPHEGNETWSEDHSTAARVGQAENLAYVIYTSGSTGKPKGVMIEHRAVSNLIAGVSCMIAFEPQQTILSLTTISFDIFVLETWLPLARGLRVVLANEDEQREPEQLANALTRHRVNLLQATPSRMQLLLSDERSRAALMNLQTLMIGGEAFPTALLDELRIATQARIYNMYGPTETTVWSMIKDVTDTHEITLGRPIANTQVYVLDKDLQPLPEGVPGELFIAGDGMARGYLQQPELTAERFVVNPFAPGVGEAASWRTLQDDDQACSSNEQSSNGELWMNADSFQARENLMYRTGDRVQWNIDGEIHFLGRVDHQVKIRGYRIELGEIEALLRHHPQIQDAVVVVRTAGEDVLSAYYVPALPDLTEPVTALHGAMATELRAYLTKSLPEYMIPSFFIPLEQLPLTPNGKVDRAALPEVGAGPALCHTYVAPTDEMEETLARIWVEVLHVERVGIEDHFFEMGGHSLKGTYMVAKIARELGVQVPLREIFTRPTIRTLAQWIRQEQRVEHVTIPRVEARPIYPTSSAQKRMFVVQHLQADGTSYNLPTAVMIEGVVDVERMERAVQLLVQRHESLRTSFMQVGEEIMQVIHADMTCPLHREMVNVETLTQRMAEFVRPFDLIQGPLFRAALWTINGVAEKSVLLFDMHHIISDGTSLGILIREWIELYQGYTLAALPIQYKDFALWQQGFLQSEALQKQEAYWVNRFRESIPVLNLPTDDLRSTKTDLSGAVYEFTVEPELAEALGRVSKQQKATLYMTLLATYQILLAKYAGQEEVVVGSPISGRAMAETQSIVGMFVNTLAMRNEPTGEKTFAQFLSEVRENALEAYANQDYPFEQLVEQLQLERDLTSNPLFNVMFVLQNFDLAEVQLPGMNIRQLPLENGTAKFDLTLMAVEREGGIAFNLEYRTRLFTAETMARMASHYVNILQEVVATPTMPLAQISMISQIEKEKLLYGFNRTETREGELRTVIQCFDEQVKHMPDAIALICNDRRVTYRDLNESSNRWARRLRQFGVRPEQRVGLLVERSVEMIIAIFAIWKAGGAYVPLDPDYPQERLQFMADDSGVQVLLTQTHWMDRVSVMGETLDLSDPLLPIDEEVRVNRLGNLADTSLLHIEEKEWVNRPGDLAYIIYTSGTTGRPKGVMIEHRNISNTLEWRKQEYQLNEADRVLQFFSFAFDGFLTSSFTPLISGASIIMLDGEQAKDPLAIRQVIVREQVTHFIAVPSLYGSLLECLTADAMASLRMVTLAGEAVTPNLVQRSKALRPEVELINEYGPTENSVVSTWMRDLEPGQAITIGLPIANTQAYILDQHLQPLPVGVPGEICVSGAGLARGYVNLPVMTAERFVDHPFRRGERLYRTGDLGRRQPDGQIVFVGRVDEQVKIRGFRIELGEIANQLLQHPAISEAVVLDREDAEGQTYLVAYFVSHTELSHSELRSALGNELPGYMIPSAFVQLESIPLTANGKVDRKALPEVEICLGLGTAYVAPIDNLEERLLAIWCQVLGVKGIGMEDHFFELGGHSLKAMNLVGVVMREFQVELPLRTIFQSPTVKEMAQRIRETVRLEGYTAIPRADLRAYYPLSSAQKRLFILDQIMGPNTSYNTPGYMIVEGDLDRERFTAAVDALVARHEVFRTSFTMMEEEPVQVIHPFVPLTVEYGVSGAESVKPRMVGDEALQRIVREFTRPFDLAKAPLLRVGLVRMGQRHFVMFDMHHIISDGTSLGILIREFIQLYAGNELPEPKIQYKDFAIWQNQQMEGTNMLEQGAYWREQFAGDIPMLHLLTDFPREEMAGHDGDLVRFTLSRELTEGLVELSANQGATLFMTLLAIYTILLGKMADQSDVVVGTPVAGRGHADVHSLLGVFLNTLALRNQPTSEKRFAEFLAEVKENTLKAYENQDYPFEKLVETLDLPVEPGTNPLFNVMLVLQNQDRPTIEMEGSQWIPYELREMAAKFDVTLYVSESPEGLQMALNYRTHLFLRESMERIRDRWIGIAQAVVANPEIRIGEVEAVSDEEEERFLMDFNEDLDDDF